MIETVESRQLCSATLATDPAAPAVPAAFDPSFTGGIYVAAGDVSGTGAAGGGPSVRTSRHGWRITNDHGM